MIERIVLVILGIILIAASGYLSPAVDGLVSSLGGRLKDPGTGAGQEVFEGDDILDNKTKWRIIVAGFVLLALVAVFSLISVYTLNKKINTLYDSVRNMEEDVGALKTSSADE